MTEQKLEDKTLKELKAELVNLGMPIEETESFNTKSQIVAVINTIKAKEVVKKVDSLEEKETPAEKRQFEKQYISKAMVMKKKLDAQPKVRFLLPLEPNEKVGVVEWRTGKNGEQYQQHISGAIETVQLNGYKYLIPKGSYCEIPQQIADVLAQAYRQMQQAGANISMDRVDEKTGKPMREIM